MKNGEADAQIPELVARAMAANYEYSLEQLKKLPHADEIMNDVMNDVLNPSASGSEMSPSDLSGGAGPSTHVAAVPIYTAVPSVQHPPALSAHGFSQENAHMVSRPHAGPATQHSVPTRPPPVPISSRTKVVKTSPSNRRVLTPKPTLITAAMPAAAAAAAAVAAAAAAAAAAGQTVFRHHQHYIHHPASTLVPPAGGGKEMAASSKVHGAPPENGKPMSKQQAKQHQYAHHHAHHHSHAHSAAQQHHMMMGHIHAGYLSYPPMQPGAAYTMPPMPPYAMHHQKAMAHMGAHEYAALPPPGSEILAPSTRDGYSGLAKGIAVSAKAAHTHNFELSNIMGKPGETVVAKWTNAPPAKGPAGKAKCKPPRAGAQGSASISNGKQPAGAAAASSCEMTSICHQEMTSVLGAIKSQVSTRGVHGKLLQSEVVRPDLCSPTASMGILTPGLKPESTHSMYPQDAADSPALHSMHTIHSPAMGSLLSPSTHYVLAPLSTEKGPRAFEPQSTRLGPDGAPGSMLGGQLLPGPGQWFLSPLLQSKDSPMWRSSPFMQSNLSPQVGIHLHRHPFAYRTCHVPSICIPHMAVCSRLPLRLSEPLICVYFQLCLVVGMFFAPQRVPAYAGDSEYVFKQIDLRHASAVVQPLIYMRCGTTANIHAMWYNR